MNMHVKKGTFITVLLLVLTASNMLCQEQKSFLAYAILDDYIEEKELRLQKKTGPLITIISGGTLMLAGGAVMLWGGPLFSESSGRFILGSAVAGSGLITTAIGTAFYFRKPRDIRGEYSFVFSEEDTEAREALAAAALRDMADSGRRERITAGCVSIAVPLITGGVKIGTNIAGGNKWHEGLISITSWQIWAAVTGVINFFTRSEGERVYNTYLSARETLED